MKNKTIQAITIVLFFTLIIVFVIYKSGLFANKEIVNINSSKSLTKDSQTDTIPNLDSILKSKPIISSSKSMIILDSEDFKAIEIDSTMLDSIKN